MPTQLDNALEAIITGLTAPGQMFATVPFERGGVEMPAFAAAPPTLAHYFAHFANQNKDLPFLVDGDIRLTFGEAYAAATCVAEGLVQTHGIEKGDRIAICLKNGVQWVAIDQAALGMGLVVVPLYVIDNAENIAWCIGNSDARLLVLDTPRALPRLRELMPALPAVVCIEAPAAPAAGDIPAPDTLATFLPASAPAFEVEPLEPDALATVVYTSGTTGKPKGVKLGHAGILANVEASSKVLELRGTDTSLSVLPMSHMFERTCGYYLMLHGGVCVAYARGIQQLGEDLLSIRPTLLVAVPRLFERFLARIEQAVAGSAVKRALFRITVGYGWKVFLGEANLFQRMAYARLQPLVAAPILEKLGGRLRLAAAGGAKLELRIARTFIGLGLKMIQGYGLTEASPVIAGNREDDNDPSSVGQLLDGLAKLEFLHAHDEVEDVTADVADPAAERLPLRVHLHAGPRVVVPGTKTHHGLATTPQRDV
jgi:long-chain acyl-CoA synthetase